MTGLAIASARTGSLVRDLVALTNTNLPPPPWVIDNEGGIVGGPPAVPGILWTHVVDFGGTPTENLPPDGDRAVADLAGTYGELTTAIARLVRRSDPESAQAA